MIIAILTFFLVRVKPAIGSKLAGKELNELTLYYIVGVQAEMRGKFSHKFSYNRKISIIRFSDADFSAQLVILDISLEINNAPMHAGADEVCLVVFSCAEI